jgi:predicted  nucleic acid-binding Zn-ribbon protein
MEKSKADGTEYQSKVAALTAEIDGLNGEIAAHQEGFKALERKYAQMKQDIANLPAEKAKPQLPTLSAKMH